MADPTSPEKDCQDRAESAGQPREETAHEPAHEQEPAQGKEEQQTKERAAEQTGSNGAPAESTTAAADDFEAVMRRAEAVVDRTAERVGFYAAKAWRQARRLASRAQEEAEDMWIEAQALRRGKTPDGDD